MKMRQVMAGGLLWMIPLVALPFPGTFYYQGRLISGTNLYNGALAMTFRLYNGPAGGTALYTDTNLVNVVDGLYAVVIGDAPGDLRTVLTNESLYLESDIGGIVLAPREQINAVAYALAAGTVTNGAITSVQLANGAVGESQLAPASVSKTILQNNAVSGSKIEDAAVTSAKIQNGSLTVDDIATNTFWRTDGNAGLSSSAFVGSTDGPRFEARCRNVPVLQVNLAAEIAGAQLALGSSNSLGTSPGAVIGGGFENKVEDNGYNVTLSGGRYNTVERDAQNGVLGGGYGNRIGTNAVFATLAGGRENAIVPNSFGAAIGGGQVNTIAGTNSVVGGGYGNRISAKYGVIGGGHTNTVLSEASVISGGYANMITGGSSSAISGGSFNECRGAQSFIGGGTGNRAGVACVIGGGLDNQATEQLCTIAGGDNNIAGGGNGWDTVGGGSFNMATGTYATVAGGSGNRADREGFVGGGYQNKIKVGSLNCVIAGGEENTIESGLSHDTIGGGWKNFIVASYNTIGGGVSNTLYAPYSCIGGGYKNFCQGSFGAVAGGGDNTVDASYGAIGGGWDNFANYADTVAGGVSNRADGGYSTIPGGLANQAAGLHSFAAGRRAKATNDGAFVWADARDADFSSTLDNQFNIRASNGVRVVGSSDLGSLLIAPNQASGTRHSQLMLAEEYNGAYGMLLKYDGQSNHLYIAGVTEATNISPRLVILRSSARVGVGRIPTDHALEVEGNASKTTAGEWLANSDAAIKQDVRPITNALETLAQLRPVRFLYTDEYRAQHPSVENRDYCNYIAQEYQTVFPESVKTGGDGLLQVDTYNTQPYLVRAVQELHGMVNELRQENEALRQRVTELEAVR